MSQLKEVAYRLDPVLWVREVLGEEPTRWQQQFLPQHQEKASLVVK